MTLRRRKFRRYSGISAGRDFFFRKINDKKRNHLTNDDSWQIEILFSYFFRRQYIYYMVAWFCFLLCVKCSLGIGARR